MSDLVQGINAFFDRQVWIDRYAKPVQDALLALFRGGGRAGQGIADFFHGIWLGHPLHPVITDIPIGAWTATIALDAMEANSGSRGLAKAADATAAIGVAAAFGAAAAGFTDWKELQDESRRTGFLHASLNILALGLFIGSLAARSSRNRGMGRALALAGFTISGASAYLGGDLVFRQKIGVNHAPDELDVSDFQAVIPLNQLPENQLTRGQVKDIPLVLLRRGEQIFALAETCAHMGGPLSEGQLKEGPDGDPVVVCPWHYSNFNMATGDVIHGPSAYPQPCFETRVMNGMVEVRRRPVAAG
jgi:nitrite reductase/ring-hydroxylating ferredoxin subunit/uncharacterized membrane protein